MRRLDLEHLLRAASQIVGDSDVLVIGSQAILAEILKERLPPEATRSAKADLAFLNEDGTKWAKVDGAIGEMSQFDATLGYHAQGVEVSTAKLPHGWRDRLIRWDTPNTAPGGGWLLERHDCVASKLAADREKDIEFAVALLEARLVDVDVLIERVGIMDLPPEHQRRMVSWLSYLGRHGG